MTEPLDSVLPAGLTYQVVDLGTPGSTGSRRDVQVEAARVATVELPLHKRR